MTEAADSTKSLTGLFDHAIKEIKGANSVHDLHQIRARWLGKKGSLNAEFAKLGSLQGDEKRHHGMALNKLRDQIKNALQAQQTLIQNDIIAARLREEHIDVTLPYRGRLSAGYHPLTRTVLRIQEIFGNLGFSIAHGPEIESEYYNFTALNIPADHPARAMQDTFYIDQTSLLRTQTSPVQIHYIQSHPPPIFMIAPGRVYRCDSDITHTPMFHQVEGLAIDSGISFADLKGILTHFVRAYFEKDLGVRFRPSYFPFTEPSAEVDISCVFCEGDGCRVCEQNGWLEVLGCGMVHPEVFKSGDIDPEIYTGYAFGMGVERLAMLRYGVNDIRLFFENDLGMLGQFRQ